MRIDAMFFHLFLIFSVIIPLVTSQPCPCPNNYNNQPPLILQPSNTQPYYQVPNNQNQMQIDPAALQETLNQLVFTKFLSNPSLKSILNPNPKLLSQNGVEEQKQLSNSNTPSVINNYFIVPPEFFNLNDTIVRKNSKNKPKTKIKKNQEVEANVIKEYCPREGTRNKKGRKRTKAQNLEATPYPDNGIVLIKEENKPKKRKRIKTYNKKEDIDIQPRLEKLIDNSEDKPEKGSRKTRRRKHKQESKIESHENVRPTQYFEELSELKSLEVIPEIEKENPRVRKNKRNKTKVNQNIETEGKHLKNIEEPIDNPERSIELTENRQIRNSKTSKRKEPKENVPPIPDDVMKSFYPFFNNFYGNMPFNYEQFYNLPNFPMNTETKPKRRKNNRTEKPKSNTINVKYKMPIEPEITEKPITETIKDVTTEKEEVTEVTTEIPIDTTTVSEEVQTKENYETLVDEIEDLQKYIVPELRQPAPYNNFISDYYPIFYDQSLYSQEDEQPIRSEESRYFYNTESRDLLREHRKFDRRERFKLPKVIENDAELFIPQRYTDKEGLRSKFKDSSINLEGDRKTLEKYSKEQQKKEEDERETFRTPPGLENPDFKTRNIKDVDEIKDLTTKDVQFNKLSVFSEAKTDLLPEIKRIRVPSKNIRPKQDNIETICANSKVVKYGVPQESTESDESISNSNEDGENFDDGHTTYVVAKSLGKVDDYYW